MQPPYGTTLGGSPFGCRGPGVSIIFIIAGVIPGGSCEGAAPFGISGFGGIVFAAGIADDIGIAEDCANAADGTHDASTRTATRVNRRALTSLLSNNGVGHLAPRTGAGALPGSYASPAERPFGARRLLWNESEHRRYCDDVRIVPMQWDGSDQRRAELVAALEQYERLALPPRNRSNSGKWVAEKIVPHEMP